MPENGFQLGIGSAASEFALTAGMIGTDEYGGLTGINLTADDKGEIAFSANMVSLVSTLIDTLSVNGFRIYIDKRNDYW